jgi:uncharacterized protein YndB with AHSA1/START domain
MRLPVALPDLSWRPHETTIVRDMTSPPEVIYRAWTEQLDRWLAEPGTVLMKAEANAPFFFESRSPFEPRAAGGRQAHYGRFLKLARDTLIEMTWVTGPHGTGGTETVLSIELQRIEGGTRLRLTHGGFADDATCAQHAEAWPLVLEQLEELMGQRLERSAPRGGGRTSAGQVPGRHRGFRASPTP